MRAGFDASQEFSDKNGLFWGKLFRAINIFKKIVKLVLVALVVAVAVLLLVAPPAAGVLLSVLGKIAAYAFTAGGAIEGTTGISFAGAALLGLNAVGAIANHLQGDQKKCGVNKTALGVGLALLMLQGSDKIPSDAESDYECGPFDSCAEMGEKIRDLTKSVGIRRRELDPDTASYPGHAEIWARQKNILNKCIQKFKEKGCGDGDMPPGSPLKDAISEAGAKAPATRGVGDFIRRGGLIIPGILLCTISPALCARVLIPKPGTGQQPVPVPAH